jgi:hypothetical protein
MMMTTIRTEHSRKTVETARRAIRCILPRAGAHWKKIEIRERSALLHTEKVLEFEVIGTGIENVPNPDEFSRWHGPAYIQREYQHVTGYATYNVVTGIAKFSECM